FAGVREAHIGTSATNFSGATNVPGARHFYRDIAIPAAATNIFLSFYLKLPGEDAGYDFLKVYTTTTANIPVNGTIPGAGYAEVFSYDQPALATYWGMQAVQLPNSLAGTTVRLVFSYIVDGINPDAYFALDNISLTYGGYCTAIGSVAGFEKISNVTLTGAGINNNSTSIAGYENFTTVTGNVTAGQTYAFSASAATTYANDQVMVWIDVNQDNDFDDASELVFTSTIHVSPWTGNIIIPLTASVGTTRMRVRLHDTGESPNTTPCLGSLYGQVEDYTLNIAAPPPCSGTPNPGNTLSSLSTVCSSTSFTLNLQNNPPVGGLTYQWQSASDFAFTTPVNL
ncbi:MAG TPA: GEVED domain-containing protein, partial [Ferruginibacter sp.]|nr:GEVED domain-containing protein [Ferruginibacter sp.]